MVRLAQRRLLLFASQSLAPALFVDELEICTGLTCVVGQTVLMTRSNQTGEVLEHVHSLTLRDAQCSKTHPDGITVVRSDAPIYRNPASPRCFASLQVLEEGASHAV